MSVTNIAARFGTEPLTWERLGGKSYDYTERAPVSRGWLYRTVVVSEAGQVGIALTFVEESK